MQPTILQFENLKSFLPLIFFREINSRCFQGPDSQRVDFTKNLSKQQKNPYISTLCIYSPYKLLKRLFRQGTKSWPPKPTSRHQRTTRPSLNRVGPLREHGPKSSPALSPKLTMVVTLKSTMVAIIRTCFNPQPWLMAKIKKNFCLQVFILAKYRPEQADLQFSLSEPQILCEIRFDNFRRSKTAILCIFEALKFDF